MKRNDMHFLMMTMTLFFVFWAGLVSADSFKIDLGKEIDDWLSWRMEMVKQEELYRYALELFDGPIGFEGGVSTYDGNYFGFANYMFADGVIMKTENIPPESFRASLSIPGGFPDEDLARQMVIGCMQSIGFEIGNTTLPLESTVDKKRIIEYWEPIAGHNAKAFMIYEGETLVEVGYSFAL